MCADAGPDAVVLLYLYLDSCGICKCAPVAVAKRMLACSVFTTRRSRPHSRALSRPRPRRYVLPAVASLCRACGDGAAPGSSAAAGQQPSVVVLKHSLRDEYDDLTDIARLYRIKARAMPRAARKANAR